MTLPTYTVKLPSTGKNLKIRPFVVKEEKLLLMAIESNDNEEIIKTTTQIIQNCVLDKKFDASKLPFFDIDYLFIALRAKSIGESIEVKFHCNNSDKSGNRCGNEFKSNIDISNVEIKVDSEITNDISVGKGVTVKMRYPTYAEMKTITSPDTKDDLTYRTISLCLDLIVEGDNVYSRKDFSAEIDEFLGNLTKDQYSKLVRWADNLPTFYVTAQSKCPKCGFDHTIHYDEFESFFV